MMQAIAPPRPRRRPNLTPMIDVVFLLLVFFMLVARFGIDSVLPLAPAGGGAADAAWSGPPRLVDVFPDALALNGVATVKSDLPAAILPLVEGPDDPILLRPRDGATLQRTVEVIEALQAAGHRRILLLDQVDDAF